MNMNILKWINDKIDKSQIRNTLTETNTGNVLDASQGKVLYDRINGLYNSTIHLGFGSETPVTTITNANDLPQGVVMGQDLENAPVNGWLYYETRRNPPKNSGAYQRAYSDSQKRGWIRYFNSSAWDNIWTPISPAKYLTLNEVGLSDTDFSTTDLGGNIAKILNNMKQGVDFEMYVGLHFPNLSNSFKTNSPSGIAEGSLFISKRANTAIANKVEYYPNSNGTKNVLEIGFYDNNWSGLKQVPNGIRYINSGTHKLSDYTQEGAYCFGTGATITDIPTGVNGWLIVLPSYHPTSKVFKQIWMRFGTANSNSWMTFERLINNDTIGDWTEYATTRTTQIPFPYNEGYSKATTNSTTVVKTSTGTVFVPLNLKATSWDVKTHIVGVLPSGFRPLSGNIVFRRYDGNIKNIFIRTNGEICVEIIKTPTENLHDSIIFNI